MESFLDYEQAQKVKENERKAQIAQEDQLLTEGERADTPEALLEALPEHAPKVLNQVDE